MEAPPPKEQKATLAAIQANADNHHHNDNYNNDNNSNTATATTTRTNNNNNNTHNWLRPRQCPRRTSRPAPTSRGSAAIRSAQVRAYDDRAWC